MSDESFDEQEKQLEVEQYEGLDAADPQDEFETDLINDAEQD